MRTSFVLDKEYINTTKKYTEKQQFKILIVDDDIDLAASLSEILQERGHNVTITNEGISCISKCQNSNYDIIFMDYHLADINGIDTTDLIKNSCSVKSLIFAFTGDDSIAALSNFKNIGMDGAIIKPIDIDIINKLMNSLEIRNTVDNRVVKIMKDLKIKKHLFVFDQKPL
jgi:CheY-like chemotaxis protein